MTISSSLNASVAGLASNATRLAAISDNIANSATFGYKRAVTDFHSMVNGNGPGSYAAGGIRTSSTRLIDQSASLVSTGNSTDLAVRGRGLLPVMTESDVAIGNGEDSLLLSTTGSFRPDALGYLRSPAGLVLMGWPATASGDVPAFPRDSIDGLEPIQINSAQFAGEATTRIDLAVNLPATSTEADSGTGPETLSVEYFDNLGKSSTLNLSFTPTVPAAGSSSSNQWTLVVSDSESAGAIIGEYTINFDATREGGGQFYLSWMYLVARTTQQRVNFLLTLLVALLIYLLAHLEARLV